MFKYRRICLKMFALSLKLVFFFFNFINPLIIESNLLCKTTEECECEKPHDSTVIYKCENGTEIIMRGKKHDVLDIFLETKELTKTSGIHSFPKVILLKLKILILVILVKISLKV